MPHPDRRSRTSRPTVYVCICNAVSESDVHSCVAAGACSTKQVKNACGWKPGCGSCTRRLAEVFGQAMTATSVASAQAPAA
ncbi:(2Fe-2S)-binding protein [Nocardia albiluteola]|uniref:(2Fe-2S)-binding protein n=1 Tax=Nocardia albiluteola TaxID=2842303 RepID=UPI0027E03D9F|nr:(2Fe-2S)-binding protein [Nocardia albiluteola]